MEIQAQAVINQKNLEAYFDKNTLPPVDVKYSGILPSDFNQTGNKTSLSLIPADKKGTSASRFNYTEFVDQALITSLNNNTVDVKNPQ